MKLKVHKLNKLLRIEGTGGGKVPYKGYVETLLELPEIPDFKEYVFSVDPSTPEGWQLAKLLSTPGQTPPGQTPSGQTTPQMATAADSMLFCCKRVSDCDVN